MSRIDPAGLQTLRTLPVDGTPTGIAASADAVWVAETAPGLTGTVSLVRIAPDFNTIGPPQRISQVVTAAPDKSPPKATRCGWHRLRAC